MWCVCVDCLGYLNALFETEQILRDKELLRILNYDPDGGFKFHGRQRVSERVCAVYFC